MKLWYFRNRRYLTGIDWVVGALHEAGKKRIGLGAVSQAIIQVSGRLDDDAVRAALDAVSGRFPLVHGFFSRDWWNLAPYWKVPGGAKRERISLRVVEVRDATAARALLEAHVNEPLASEREHLRLLLVHVGSGRANAQRPTLNAQLSTGKEGQSWLGLVFDHRLLDAYGAESFFRLMDEAMGGRLEEIAAKVPVTQDAQLDHWGRRFASGRTLNRLLAEMQKKDVCALAMPEGTGKRAIRFVSDELTVEQTTAINTAAFAEIGVPILLPSAAARAVAAVGKVIPEMPLAGEQYLLFTSTNMRAVGSEAIFFNHFSFVLFSAPCGGEVRSVKETAVGLRDQFFQHMKDKVPFAMADAAALGRIAPRSVIGKLINRMFKGRMCSFYFACLKECGFSSMTFLGCEVVNLVHTPLAFAPPGMNLCMTSYGGRFNLVLSYLEGVMGEETAREILGEFKGLLVK